MQAMSRKVDLEDLLQGVYERKRRALGRAVSILENRSEGHRRLLQEIYPRTGRARVIGVTGPPGAGKSTLVDRLARCCRERGESVAILAVDPSSPFTGGALLGDRVRMQGLASDSEVFIRSMATRGAMGGLALAAGDVIDLLDGAGFDWILVETVGVGQDETEVVRTVDLVVLVTVPGLGDEIQAIKAGIMEIADLFVVNKADRDGADRALEDLRSALSMVEGEVPNIPILRTVATRNEGVAELLDEVVGLHEKLAREGRLTERRFEHLRLRVEAALRQRVLERTHESIDVEARLRAAFESGEDPYRVSDELFELAFTRAEETGEG